MSDAGHRSHAAVPRIGRGLLVAGLLLLAAELALHSDAVLHRYRSVFAAGRALDKTLYAERHCPPLLLLGNSRIDNAFDPRTLRRHLSLQIERDAFNLGVPGADSRVLAGIVDRIDAAGCLRRGGVERVVLGLDEATVQPVDTLGQEVFFAGTRRLLRSGQYHDALRSVLRLYGYSANLRQLREPATLQRFVRATLDGSIDPVGGGAAQHLGYRAGFGALQDMQSALQQEAGAQLPPDSSRIAELMRMLDLLAQRGVAVDIVLPPMLGREVLYVGPPSMAADPYQRLAAELRGRGLRVIRLREGAASDATEFVNPGHLNDRGAQRYTRLLAEALGGSGETAQAAAARRAP